MSEERLRRLEDALIVETELLARHERLNQSRHDQTEAMMKLMAAQTGEFRAQMLEFRATAVRVLDLLERFIQGQQGTNGHHD